MTLLAPVAVAVALAAVAAGQAAAILRDQPLPDEAQVEVLPTGYSYGNDGDRLLVGFQLGNTGPAVRVEQVGADLPGLRLADVIASGAPFDYRAAGEGAGDLPAFDLAAGEVVVLTLVYELQACSSVPADTRLVPVSVRTGRAVGTLGVALPSLPAEEPGAAEDALDPWQRALVRSLCE